MAHRLLFFILVRALLVLISAFVLSLPVTTLGSIPQDCTEKVLALRRRLIEEYSNRIATSPLQNETWMSKAEKTPPDGQTIFLAIENAALKHLNDTMKDKTRPTALTNKHQDLDIQEIDQVLRSYPNVQGLPYSDYKTIRYAFEPKSKRMSLPADFRLQLQAAYSRAQNRYRNELSSHSISRPEDGDPSWWFRGGTGSTADQSSITARVARELVGPGVLLDFNDEVVQRYIEAHLILIHTEQMDITESLKGSPLLMDLPLAHGQTILRPQVFELYRKYPEPALLKNTIKKRFDFEATDDQIDLIQTYIQNVNIFSPAIRIRNREIASLSGSKYGGFSIDFVGQGGVNLSQTAHALSVSSTVEKALYNARLNEYATTEEFNHKKELVKERIKHILNRDDFKGVIRISGDDMVFRPEQPLTTQIVREIAQELVKVVTPSSLRVAFVLPDHGASIPYDEFISLGENLEKQTRARLEGIIPMQKLENLLLIVEVSPTERNLLVASRQGLAEDEMTKIHNAFASLR